MKFTLPEDKAPLSRAMRDILARGKQVRNPRSVEWKINYYYLQGVRRFFIQSYETGEVQGSYESNEGQNEFRLEDALNNYNIELGAMLSVDPRPDVYPRKSRDLEGLRKAAGGQVYLDHITAPMNILSVYTSLCEGLLMYGLMGVGCFVEEGMTAVEGSYITDIPPWELIPVPTQPTRPGDLGGICRNRKVPLKPIATHAEGRGLELPPGTAKALERAANGKSMSLSEKLHVDWVPLGEDMKEGSDNPGGMNGSIATSGMDGEDTNDDANAEYEPFVELSELWLYDSRMRCYRYIVMLGDWVAKDRSWEDWPPDERPLCPIATCRSRSSGSFFGRPWLSGIVSLNTEAEEMLGNLFHNVKTLDMDGITLYPANQGITQDHFNATVKPKAIPYENDYMGQKFQVERITPTNTGETPGRVASTAISLIDRVANINDLMRGDAPGRVESAMALGVIHESGGVSRKAMIAGLDFAISHVYRCLLQKGRSEQVGAIDIGAVDHRLAGISVQPDGSVQLTGDMIPSPHEVRVTLKHSEPRMRSYKTREVLENLDRGLIPAWKLSWINHVEELGLTLGDDELVGEIEQTMMDNLVMFNDGQQPQPVIVSEFDNHELRIEIINQFMKTNAYRVAESAVRDAFQQRIMNHRQYLGFYPDGIPYPEEAGASLPPMQGNLPQSMEKASANLTRQAGEADIREALAALTGGS